MTHVSPLPGPPPRVPPVEPELLRTALFLFGEYLHEVAAELPPEGLEDEDLSEPHDDEGDDDSPPVDTRAVLDLFAEELGTSVQVTLNLYMRVTALFRLLAASPSLTRLAMEESDSGGALTEEALVAAARLELHVSRTADDGSADFDPREFRNALVSD